MFQDLYVRSAASLLFSLSFSCPTFSFSCHFFFFFYPFSIVLYFFSIVLYRSVNNSGLEIVGRKEGNVSIVVL